MIETYKLFLVFQTKIFFSFHDIYNFSLIFQRNFHFFFFIFSSLVFYSLFSTREILTCRGAIISINVQSGSEAIRDADRVARRCLHHDPISVPPIFSFFRFFSRTQSVRRHRLRERELLKM